MTEVQSTLQMAETSYIAYKDIMKKAENIKSIILDILKDEPQGINGDVITALYMSRTGIYDKHIASTQVRPRITELKNEGMIESVCDRFGNCIKTKSKFSGKLQMVWRIK